MHSVHVMSLADQHELHSLACTRCLTKIDELMAELSSYCLTVCLTVCSDCSAARTLEAGSELSACRSNAEELSDRLAEA